MLTEFDQSTIANMTAALDYVCKKIPPDKDSNELRKRVADQLIRCARTGKRTLFDLQESGLQESGLQVLKEATKSAKFNWLGLIR
jgi:hypothetical protein